MVKTLDEIKNEAKSCRYAMCESCLSPYSKFEAAALACIQQLENHIGELTEMVQQLERERDAAVNDLKKHGALCAICLHTAKFIYEEPCITCSKISTANEHNNWQWRGVQEEKHAD